MTGRLWAELAPFGLAAGLGLICLLSVRIYAGTGYGFPLDDPWIHQTIARNFFALGGMYYAEGRPVAASTAPLWTWLMAVGHLLGVDPVGWALGWGLAFVGLAGYQAARLARRLAPNSAWAGRAGLLVAGEAHILWSGLSGMETAAAVWVVLVLLTWGLSGPQNLRGWAFFGAAAAVGTLLRPELGLLAGLVGLARAAADGARADGPGPLALRAAAAALVWALLVGPVGLWNWQVTGSPLPSTFLAKYVGYGGGRGLASLGFFLPTALTELIRGPLLLVGPGFLVAAARFGRRPETVPLILWPPVLLVVLSQVVPATFHHGRYLQPALPPLLVGGLLGVEHALAGLGLKIVRRWFPQIVFFAMALFDLAAARNYGLEVRWINDEHLGVARWVRTEIPPGAVIASHDVGALGYFGGRTLIDTAGLLNPELIHSVRDPDRLVAELRRRGADYLVFFPAWYPNLVGRPDLPVVFEIRTAYARRLGGDDLIVVALSPPDTP